MHRGFLQPSPDADPPSPETTSARSRHGRNTQGCHMHTAVPYNHISVLNARELISPAGVPDPTLSTKTSTPLSLKCHT